MRSGISPTDQHSGLHALRVYLVAPMLVFSDFTPNPSSIDLSVCEENPRLLADRTRLPVRSDIQVVSALKLPAKALRLHWTQGANLY